MLSITVKLTNGDAIEFSAPNEYTEFKMVGSDASLPTDVALYLDNLYSFADHVNS
jgi:hypothetical protein